MYSRTDGRDGAYWCRDAHFAALTAAAAGVLLLLSSFLLLWQCESMTREIRFVSLTVGSTVNQTNNPSAQSVLLGDFSTLFRWVDWFYLALPSSSMFLCPR